LNGKYENLWSAKYLVYSFTQNDKGFLERKSWKIIYWIVTEKLKYSLLYMVENRKLNQSFSSFTSLHFFICEQVKQKKSSYFTVMKVVINSDKLQWVASEIMWRNQEVGREEVIVRKWLNRQTHRRQQQQKQGKEWQKKWSLRRPKSDFCLREIQSASSLKQKNF